jgi:xylulokinase
MKNIGTEKTYKIGGNPVWAINSALRMLWVKENEPRIFSETFKWLLIEDFINFKLTGRFATDNSMASCTMLFDQKKRNWSEELCQLAGIPLSILPEVLPSSTFLGTVGASAASATELKEGTPVFLGGHDHICSSLPVGAFRAGSIMNITGTWETIGLVSTVPPIHVPLGENGIMTQSHVLADRYMIWGGNPAGEMLEWYRRAVAVEAGKNDSPLPDWDILISLAESATPGSGGVMFLPHLDGCQCPWVDPYSRGTLIGLNARTSHQELFRSVIEGLGYQILTVIQVMESSLGMKATEVVATGGAVRNRFWMQNKADVTGLRVRIPAIEEATVLGAAMLAGIGLGTYRDAEDAFAQVCKKSETFEPNEERTAFYQERFPLFQELYTAVSPLHRKIA